MENEMIYLLDTILGIKTSTNDLRNKLCFVCRLKLYTIEYVLPKMMSRSSFVRYHPHNKNYHLTIR